MEREITLFGRKWRKIADEAATNPTNWDQAIAHWTLGFGGWNYHKVEGARVDIGDALLIRTACNCSTHAGGRAHPCWRGGNQHVMFE